MVQYGQTYNILARETDDLNSPESKKELTKAQSEAQKMLQQALIQMEQTIQNAQQKAQEILNQAQMDAELIQQQAQEMGQQQGFDEGYQAGYNQAIQESLNIIEASETIINGAYQAQKEIMINSEREMIELITAIAKKIIHKELKTQPDIIIKLTESAIRELKDRDLVKVIVNPQNVEILQLAAQELKEKISSLEVIKIIEDRNIPMGGVIVESVSGKIDAQVDVQLEEIYNKLIDESIVNPALIEVSEPKMPPAQSIKNFQSSDLKGSGKSDTNRLV